jgi:hypothetical protein
VSDCILKAMHTDPGTRFHTATEFVEALARALGISPVQ